MCEDSHLYFKALPGVLTLSFWGFHEYSGWFLDLAQLCFLWWSSSQKLVMAAKCKGCRKPMSWHINAIETTTCHFYVSGGFFMQGLNKWGLIFVLTGDKVRRMAGCASLYQTNRVWSLRDKQHIQHNINKEEGKAPCFCPGHRNIFTASICGCLWTITGQFFWITSKWRVRMKGQTKRVKVDLIWKGLIWINVSFSVVIGRKSNDSRCRERRDVVCGNRCF